LIAALKTRHEGLELRLCDASAKELRNRLLEGELEVAVYALPGEEVDERTHALPLFKEQMTIAVHQGHRLVGQGCYPVAELNGELVGFVGVRENKHLYHLFVSKALQRRGIGRKLWEFAKGECQTAGYRGAFTVNSSNNALPAYERWGFRRDGDARTSNGITFNPMKLEVVDD
jgi:GNAT superfamily N-acetyltransferase